LFVDLGIPPNICPNGTSLLVGVKIKIQNELDMGNDMSLIFVFALKHL
jgi:hypothetical protein